MPSTLRQGVTSVVVGNCGMSPFPASSATQLAAWAGGDAAEMDLDFGTFGGFLERVEEAKPSVNVAALVGHGSVRELAMGLERRAPDEELAAMRRTVVEAMDAGAVGLSTGLIYVRDVRVDRGDRGDGRGHRPCRRHLRVTYEERAPTSSAP